MTKQEEDTMYEVYEKVETLGLRKKFDKQIKKMNTQEKHNNKSVSERWEYALQRLKDNGTYFRKV